MLNTLKLSDINPELINLTGVRLLVLFSLLLEAPRTVDEINNYFEQNNYPKNIFSTDTLRNDLNSLRQAGCEISRADKSNNFEYKLLSHPFELNIEMELAQSLSKIYTKCLEDLSVKELLLIENLFNKLAQYAKNEETAEYILGISILKRIDKSIIKDINTAILKSKPITFTYKSPNSGKITLDFIPEKFEIRSNKLYVNGYSLTHKNDSFILVSKIISPIIIHFNSDDLKHHCQSIIYELVGASRFELEEDEKIIKNDGLKYLVEYTSNNEFKTIQKIMSYGSDCKVIEPIEIREKITKKLEDMKKVYGNA